MGQQEVSAAKPDLQLPPGLTEAQIARAIDQSGYPLQTIVSSRLRQFANIHQQAEWGYLDRTTGQMRALDLLAIADYTGKDLNKYRVRPAVTMLIECKKAELPYVFFTDEVRPYGNFPHVAGLKSEDIAFKTDDDRSTWSFPILSALSLDRHSFILDPDACATFSKCERKGKEVVLSGSDPYQSLVLPLRSASDHYRTSVTPPHTAYYFDVQLVVAISVIDAPMLAAQVSDDGTTTFKKTTWQRVWRNEPDPTRHRREHGETSAIDIVHVDFLDDYLRLHLFPFAEEFAQRAHRHAEELASGLAFASGMGHDSFNRLERRMEPRKMSIPMSDTGSQESLPRAIAGVSKDVISIALNNLRRRAQRRKRKSR